jgi:hypothetical protein
MLISAIQQEANQKNAQHSTGPVTPEGKAAVRLNALTYGLRARSLLIPGEDPEEYKQLWDDFVAEWKPANRGERIQLERMATSYWLLARIAHGEAQIYQDCAVAEKQLAMLNSVATVRARLERSYDKGMKNLEHLQRKRQASRPQPAQKAKAAAPPRVPQPGYMMSEGEANHPAFSAPAAPDSR